MSVVVVVVLAVFVLPRFVVFFKSLERQAPLPDADAAADVGFVSTWWWAIVGVLIVAFVVGFIAMRRSPKGRAKLDALMLKVPVLGDLIQAAVLERVCRVLSSMIRAGVDLPQAMTVTADSTNNAVYHDAIEHIREQMMEGQGLAGPLAETGLFPGAARQMFRVGEETGTLDQQLETAAEYYSRELDVQGEALHEPVRACRHHLHGCRRRLRRRRADLGDVRHLQPGEDVKRMYPALPEPARHRGGALPTMPEVETRMDFTLIELVIVTLVLPIIIGAIALALVSIFSLQGSVSGRLTGSGDAQVVSSNFEKDVQSAALVSAPLQGINYVAPTNPAPCASAAQSGDPQVLGLQWGGGQTGAMQTEVSYVEVPVVNGSSTTYNLVRNVCQIGSTIPNSTSVVSSNVSSGEQAAVTCAATLSGALTQNTSYSSLSVSSLPLAVTSGDSVSVSSPGTTPTVAAQSFTAASPTANAGATTISVSPQAASGNFPAGSQVVDQSWTNTNCGASSGWISAVSLTGITLSIKEPGAKTADDYTYTLVALPGAQLFRPARKRRSPHRTRAAVLPPREPAPTPHRCASWTLLPTRKPPSRARGRPGINRFLRLSPTPRTH